MLIDVRKDGLLDVYFDYSCGHNHPMMFVDQKEVELYMEANQHQPCIFCRSNAPYPEFDPKTKYAIPSYQFGDPPELKKTIFRETPDYFFNIEDNDRSFVKMMGDMYFPKK